MKPKHTVLGVQVSITELATDAPVTSVGLARMIIAETAGFPEWVPALEDQGDGLWLAELPAEMYAEADEDGGLILTHSAGYAVEIAIP